MEFWNDTIQTVKEWRPVNYSVAEDEDFEAVKKKAIRNFQDYLKLLDENTEEGYQEVIRLFTFSKFYGEELCNDEELNKLSRDIKERLKKFRS
ncbi:hypothetical protein [Streptococcus mitis]|uniref:hypothetical protein n=1 Tax=Streptococcus mitis TaxID=28037 RepID=UPI00119725BA|nr:hypothetical protein [Streptococcus mitis]TVV67978.1 hypothetical protein AZK30_11425 [Streptococcus pneumoniae]